MIFLDFSQFGEIWGGSPWPPCVSPMVPLWASPVLGPGGPCLDPGTNIWTRDLEIGPGLARGGFGGKHGGWKNMVSWRNGLQIGDYGVSRDQNGLYGTQEAFGKASFPQNPFKKWFPSTFPNFGKFGEGPPAPLCISYGPFVGPQTYPTPDQPPVVAAMLFCFAPAYPVPNGR